jgi:nitroreductase
MIFELIQKRRSIRKYRDQPVEDDKIKILVETLLRAPSSRGLNPWQFIIIKDKYLIKQLARAKEHGADFIKNASLAVVVCGDPKKSDVWIEDCSIASAFVQLVAESLKLGSCWIQIRNRMYTDSRTAESYIRQVLDIPLRIRVESIIAIGYPDEKKEAHPLESLDFTQVFYDYYGCLHHG